MSTISAHSALSTGRQRDPPPATTLPGRPPLLHGVPNQHVPTVILSLSFFAEQHLFCPLPPFRFRSSPTSVSSFARSHFLSPKAQTCFQLHLPKENKTLARRWLGFAGGGGMSHGPAPSFLSDLAHVGFTVFLRNRSLLIGVLRAPHPWQVCGRNCCGS